MEPQHIFLAVWVLIVIIIVPKMYFNGKKALEIFPDLKQSKILFKELGVSGNSQKSVMTRIGGASRSLNVIITDKELCLTANIILASSAEKFNLLHKIGFSEIVSVTREDNHITLLFSTKKSVDTEIHLKMRNAEGFRKTLQEAMDIKVNN